VLSTIGPLGPYGVNNVRELTAGPDGNMWLSEWGAIARVTPAGAVTEFTAGAWNLDPYGIVAGPDGNLWFADHANNSIGRITTAGVISHFTGGGIDQPSGIAAGPDGNLWFTDYVGQSVGRITTTGTVTTYTAPSMNYPTGIAAGPDGNMWFTNPSGDSIGSIGTGPVPPLDVHGTVTAGGAPAAGVVVTLLADWPSWTVAGSATTDASGHYAVVAPDQGSYRLRFFDPSGRYQRAWYSSRPTYKSATSIAVSATAPTVTADQVLAAATGDLVGRAQNAAGDGVGGIQILVFSAASGYSAGTSTGANGYYRLHGLPPGAYYVQFVDPTHRYRQQWWHGRALFPNAQTVTVAAGDTWASALMG
jgi:hypothetical protein